VAACGLPVQQMASGCRAAAAAAGRRGSPPARVPWHCSLSAGATPARTDSETRTAGHRRPRRSRTLKLSAAVTAGPAAL
jgi:hypothetical protein